MTDFYAQIIVNRSRKDHVCFGCSHIIEKESDYIKTVGLYQGEFYSNHYHRDCRDCELEFNNLIKNYDELIPLYEIETDDYIWIIDKYPEVAKRMNLVQKYVENVMCHER